jgi:hypothetical protein
LRRYFAGRHEGHLTRREPSTPFDAEDYVEIMLDTFHDRRHAFVFDINPRGVQADALRTESQDNDYSWDTVWSGTVRVPGSSLCDPSGLGLLRTTNKLTNDGRLFFVKVSYLWRR